MKEGWDNRHFSPLRLEQTGPNQWTLTEPLLYFGSDGTVVEVPAGYPTDLASVPRAVWSLFSKTGKIARASVVHDYLYETAKTRTEAVRASFDRVFRNAMKDDGVAWVGRNIVYRAVRDFGATVFYRKR